MIIRFDIYKHNPWRAPGSAPVLDACGLAGGTPWGGDVAEWGGFDFFEHGDDGYYPPTQIITHWVPVGVIPLSMQIKRMRMSFRLRI